MNILNTYTIRTLKKNKMRTLMTILGIVLSMSLFTAVILGARSGIEFIRNIEIASSGQFHAYFYDVDEAQIEQAKRNRNIENLATWQEVGWVDIETDHKRKTKLLIQSVDDGFEDLVAVNIISGRMPQSETEIILPHHVEPYVEDMFHVGDVVTLEIKERIEDGKRLGFAVDDKRATDEKHFKTIENRTYTVVGTFRRIATHIEEYNTPGFVALTKGGGTGGKALFFTLKDPSRFDDFIESQEISRHYKTHGSLLKMFGSFNNNALGQMMYSFATVLVIIISFGSITLIYNSFSISVSERTKQFGILKSIGATKSQIRRSVLSEALLLSLIAIPTGMIVGTIGIGTTLWGLKDAFAALSDITLDYVSNAVEIRLIVTPIALLIASAICLVTTLVSAYIPAFRAMRMQPIDAIRQIKDIRIKANRVRVSPLTKALFGFEGMMASKNFKRNKKSYRPTVFSLFLSITLFVSATFVTQSLKSNLDIISSGELVTDVLLSLKDDKNPVYSYGSALPAGFDERDFMKQLSKAEDVREIISIVSTSLELRIDPKLCTKEFRDSRIRAVAPEHFSYYFTTTFVEDEVFNRICEMNGIDPAGFYDGTAPKSLVYNYFDNYTEGGRIERNQLFNSGGLPAEFSYVTYREIEGYWPWRFDEEEVKYYKVSDLKEYVDAEEPKTLEEYKAVILRRSESDTLTDLAIAGAVYELPKYFFRGDTILLYPKSMMDSVIPEEVRGGLDFSYHYHFKSNDPQKTHLSLKKILIKNKISAINVFNLAESRNSILMLVDIINVFALGFVIIISIIAAANVFNTISTNILLRRREFANLRSIGLGRRSFKKMMIYECIIYGLKGIVWGVPASILLTYWIHSVSNNMVISPYSLPVTQIGIAIASVLLVVFATMIYAVRKIGKDNVIEALRNENL